MKMDCISARSPIFTQVNATFSGLETVRSFSQQTTLMNEFDLNMNIHSSTSILNIYANRAFAFWMDIVCWIYLVVVVFSFLLFSSGG